MKVSELVNKLSQLDQNLEVFCYDDGPTALEVTNPGPFDVVDASQASVKMQRIDGKPAITFEGSGGSKKVAIIGITSDF